MTAPLRRIHYIAPNRLQVHVHPDGGRAPGVPVGPVVDHPRKAAAVLKALEVSGVSPLRDEG